MGGVCDPRLTLELISDIVRALRFGSDVEIYRFFNVLRNYLKNKKCPKETIERALSILNSVYPELSESRKLLLKEITSFIKKLSKAGKKKKKPRRKSRKRRKR